MEFSVGCYGELEEGTAEWVADPTEELLRQALFSDSPLEYGTEFRLRSKTHHVMVAVVASGPCIYAGEPGRFVLSVDERTISDRMTRESVFENLLQFLALQGSV